MSYSIFFYGLVFLFSLDFLFFLPIGRWLFSRLDEEKSPGILKSCLLFGAWALALVACYSTGESFRIFGLLVLWSIFRWLFIGQRWSSVRRGCGAPGFMSHWTVRYLALFEIARIVDPSARIGQALWEAYRVDFGLIMLCAGVYKALSGYLRDEGMEYGRVNPMWGHHWRFFTRKNPFGFYPRLMNCVACFVEIISGIFILSPSPSLQMAGALAISLSFLYVTCFIRLGRLSVLMAVLPFMIWQSVRAGAIEPHAVVSLPAWGEASILFVIYSFIVALPVLKVLQYYNFLSQKALPVGLQKPFERFMNWVPIIIWRVFTADLVNFYVRIYAVGPTFPGGEKAIVNESTYDFAFNGPLILKLRFLHVCESIALTSVFTTLKYFKGDFAAFEKKLTSYSHSIVGALAPSEQERVSELRYEYVSISKGADGFVNRHVASFYWDRLTGKVRVERLDPDFDPSTLTANSPVKQAAAPGTYLSAQ